MNPMGIPLPEELETGMIDSKFEMTPHRFLPRGDLNRIITREAAKRVMSIVVPTSEEEILLDYIMDEAKAVFAIAVFVQLEGNKLHEAMSLFHQRSPPFRDLDLPIEEKTLKDLYSEAKTCYQRLVEGLEKTEIDGRVEELYSKAQCGVDHVLISIEGPVLKKEDRIWTFPLITRFQEHQKSFCAPVFNSSEADHNLFGMIVPFVEQYTTYGEGSFGVVSKYKIHQDHIILAKPVSSELCEVFAVKKLKQDGNIDSGSVASHWEAEVRAMAKMNTLDHKGHIVHFITAFRRGSREQPEHYLITEWADGGNLENLWKSMPRPQLTDITTRAVAQQILGLAEAFNAAHNLMSGDVKTGASYRHGDLKPANILWFKPKAGDTINVIGTLKICDWGEAKNKAFATVMRHSKTTADFGTRRYQPPEVDTGIHLSIAGEPKRRSRLYDMWAMGCIVLEIIVWLLYGEKGLEKFRESVRNELNDGSPFYQTNHSGDGDKRHAWVHNVVDHWMRHMAEDSACQAGTTILGGLLDIVETGLLVVKLPSGGGTYVQEVRPLLNHLAQPPQDTSSQETDISDLSRPRHDNITIQISSPAPTTDNIVNDTHVDDPVVKIVPPDDEEEDVQPKFLFGGNTRLRADQFRDRLLEIISDDDTIWTRESDTDVPNIPSSLYTQRPTHDISRRLQEHEVDYGKTSIDSKQWKFKADTEFAPQLFSRIAHNLDFPKPNNSSSEELCDTCQKLRDGIWSSTFMIQYDVESLETRARGKLCVLCSLLWGSVGNSGPLFPKIAIERRDSTLTIDGNKVPRFSLFRGSAKTRRLHEIQVGFAKLPAPDSATSFQVINEWLMDCENNHVDCKATNLTSLHVGYETRKRPTRLLDVGEGDESTIHLFETKNDKLEGDEEWIALSHRWGAKPHFCTTTDNYGKFKSGIPLLDLPATFRDAAVVTRALKCRYLWIDSICIIQEGTDADFTSEAKYMEEVYSGAKVVIAASRASGHEDGFLKPRKTRGYVGLECKEENNLPFYICEMIDDFQQHILDGALNRRGWVLQEHALARRTIFFDEHQTYWECGHGVRCETMTKLENESAKLLGDPKFPKLLDSAKQAERIIRFEELYQRYSRLGLSKPSDRPTAVAGLEQRLLRTMQVKGEFGMFDDPKAPGLLRRSLLWHRGKKIPRLTRIEFLPEQTPAPSWSWMAWAGTKIDDFTYTPGGIDYFHIPFERYDWKDVQLPWSQGGIDGDYALSAEASEYDCTRAEKEKFRFIGDTQHGSMSLKGTCVVLGVQVGTLKYVERRHYVLLIARTGRMQSNGIKRWERIGAGYLLGEFLIGEVFGVKIY